MEQEKSQSQKPLTVRSATPQDKPLTGTVFRDIQNKIWEKMWNTFKSITTCPAPINDFCKKLEETTERGTIL